MNYILVSIPIDGSDNFEAAEGNKGNGIGISISKCGQGNKEEHLTNDGNDDNVTDLSNPSGINLTTSEAAGLVEVGGTSIRDVPHLDSSSCWILITTNPNMWHWKLSRIRRGMISSGTLVMYSLSMSSTHTIMTISSIQALSWQQYWWVVR